MPRRNKKKQSPAKLDNQDENRRNEGEEREVSRGTDSRRVSSNSANEVLPSAVGGKNKLKLESPYKNHTASGSSGTTIKRRGASVTPAKTTSSQVADSAIVHKSTCSSSTERFIHGQPFGTDTLKGKANSPCNFTSPTYHRLPASRRVEKIPDSMHELSTWQRIPRKGKDRYLPPQHVERGFKVVKVARRLLPSFTTSWFSKQSKDSGCEKERRMSASSEAGCIQRMISLIFTREEFDDGPVVNSVTPEQVRTFKVVDRLVPSFAKRPVFYTLDFLTHRRVMLVFLVIVTLLGCYNFRDDMSSFTASFIVADYDRPGLRFLGNYSIRHKYPIMIIPGFISTALEVWDGRMDCIKDHNSLASIFRQRMFGPQMLLLLLTDPACYTRLFSLDKKTGYDPPGVKVRPDMGFGASDFFLPGYWVWAKVLLNLADIGYDPQSMSVFSYDWRLSPRRMHKRDGYYYYLRNHLLYLYDKNKERVVLLSHSYGVKVVLDFFHWVEEHDPGWIDKHVVHWINIGGPVLGLPKSVSALLTGDAKDTLTLPTAVRQMFDTHFSRSLRTEVIRTWSCQTAMYPSGCDDAHPDILTLSNGTRLSAKDSLIFTAQRLHESGHEALKEEADELITNFNQLPDLPPTLNISVFCLYGVDKLTEIGYVLSEDNTINSTYQEYRRVVNGVVLGNGDGTVPLPSLGYMCRAGNGWKRSTGRVITREYKDITVNSLGIRGGAASGDHVDILGNYELIETILKIVSGNAEAGEVEDRIYSDIDERIAKMTHCVGTKSQTLDSQ